MRRPLVAIYRVAPVSYWVGRALVRIPFFCLVNLLAGRKVVPELLQAEMTVDRIMEALNQVWAGPAREELLRGLDDVRASLGPPGAASRAADLVLALIAEN
jgi:lipid-A-disaccharide synthase